MPIGGSGKQSKKGGAGTRRRTKKNKRQNKYARNGKYRKTRDIVVKKAK